jgi:proteasome lid subunit RPN8/RPN11
VRIAQGLFDAIVEHARRDAPNECCGMVATRDGQAVSVHEAQNTAASPFRFEVDGLE